MARKNKAEKGIEQQLARTCVYCVKMQSPEGGLRRRGWYRCSIQPGAIPCTSLCKRAVRKKV